MLSDIGVETDATPTSSQPPSRSFSLPDTQDDSTFFFKSFQTRNPLLRVVEGVSNAIRDPTRESYGLKGSHRFNITKHLFDPNRFSWECLVNYEADVNLPEGVVCKKGAFPIYLQCHKIAPPNDDEDFSDDEYDETIFAIDIKLKLQTPKARINRDELSSLQKLFTIIGLDVWRGLSRTGFPNFSEGCQDRTFREVYQLNKEIKSGQFGTVCLGTHRARGTQVGIKIINRQNLNPNEDAAVFNEVDILASLKHQHVCPLHDFFVQKDCFFIVMEFMAGGDLFDRLGTVETYNEDEARKLCEKLLIAISYCHENNIVHGDLKPKNLLLLSKDDDSSIALADFGFASRLYAPKSLTKQCGTPYFVAPEILVNSGYDEKADMWSVGVIIYILLCGQLPFTGKKHLDLFRAIISGKYSFADVEDEISDDAKALVKGLLVTDPSKRWSAKEALDCAWIRSNRIRRQSLRRQSLMYVPAKLKGFNGRLAFKSAILKVGTMIYWRSIVGKNKKREPQDSEKKPDASGD